MIDIEKIKGKIEIIRENSGELEKMRVISLEELLKSKRDVAAGKHFLQIAIEAMIDICFHISAKEMFGVPSSNAEVVKLLGEKGVFPQGNVITYLKMVKYRNRLVHFYHEVNIEEIHNIIQNHLGDFRSFIKDILVYLEEKQCLS